VAPQGAAQVALQCVMLNVVVCCSANLEIYIFADDTSVLMADPNWNNGFYYDQLPPHTGMKLARRKFPYNTIVGPRHKVKILDW
jgi:homoserine acetyltransferase